MSNIETKVIAAAAGSGLGAALSAFLLWVLGVTAFGAPGNADQVAKALAAVPEPVGALLAILVAIGGAFIGGYVAPHTHRPDLTTPLNALLKSATGTLVKNVTDPTFSVDANGHMRIDWKSGKAMYWDEAAQSFKMDGPTPTPNAPTPPVVPAVPAPVLPAATAPIVDASSHGGSLESTVPPAVPPAVV